MPAAPAPPRSGLAAALAHVVSAGVSALARAAKTAVARLFEGPGREITVNDLRIQARGAVLLFNSRERAAVEAALASTLATGELVGRAEVRGVRLTRPAPVLPPAQAVRYFRSLVPTLDVDPLRFGPLMERRAFTLAAATDQKLLARVKEAIGRELSGASADPGRGARAIQRILDAAGVSVRNPGYADLVFRTNAHDAYVIGIDRERTAPDVVHLFPVWRYTNPVDGRERPEHGARNGNYYPAGVSFVSVRGTAARDVVNCRCVPQPISLPEWRRLAAAGARTEATP